MNYYKFGLMTLLPLMLMYEWFRRFSGDSLKTIPPEPKPTASKKKDTQTPLPPVAATPPESSSGSVNNQDITPWREHVEQQGMRIALLEEQLARATVAAGDAVAAKAALSLQVEQQALRIAQLEQELATMQRTAAIADRMLNKWRYRTFSR
ncbi:hypothetical protein [[Phormidium] sp. ETS-05]|uniref:hypothetical protein n=1 Tax=[Phormidium] sp. ETS-05 TaxID=222819 RepID=UPI0018EF0AF4|nr:hypothetical protein [[Phormidium] sp. ETS-05]